MANVQRNRQTLTEGARKAPQAVVKKDYISESMNKIEESGNFSVLKASDDKTIVCNAHEALKKYPILAERYKGLGLVESLFSKNPKEVARADFTITQQANVMAAAKTDEAKFANPASTHFRTMQSIREAYFDKSMSGLINESVNTTTSNVLSPAQAIVDMVGIFTPQSVIHHMCDPISVPRMTDIVYRLMPKYSETAAGVVAGETLFQKPTNGTYASVYRNTLAPADGVATTYAITLQPGPATPNTVVVTATIGGIQYVANDNGFGNIVSVVGNEISGTIVYDNGSNQGAVNLTFTNPPDNLTDIIIDWNYDYEADDFNNTLIRSIYIEVDNVNIRATAHPLRITVSAQAEFELKSLADYSMISAAQEAALGLISNERDLRFINVLRQMALTDPNLSFDATPQIYYPVSGLFATFETKVNYARSLIQVYMGRGTVTTIIAGANTCDIVMYCPSYQAVATEAPIGPYLFGTLQDGAVKIIKNPYMPQAEFVMYFSGYGPGDNPVLYASWLDLYVTPDIQMYDMNSYQSLASFYDMKINEFVVGYVWKGYITGYVA